METLLIVALLGAVAFFMLSSTAPKPRPPQVIYVQLETPQDSGIGCLPVVLIGIVVFAFLNMLTS